MRTITYIGDASGMEIPLVGTFPRGVPVDYAGDAVLVLDAESWTVDPPFPAVSAPPPSYPHETTDDAVVEKPAGRSRRRSTEETGNE